MRYEYDVLPNEGRNHIRILTIHPGHFEDELFITFTACPFSKDQHPQYEALSYAWGPADNPQNVTVAGKGTIPTTPNLDVALRYLRRTDVARTMWIDALCINQSDAAEKSKQITMMGDVYRLAHRVIAWIGPDDDSSGKAMCYLARVGSQIDVNWAALSFRPAPDAEDATLRDVHASLPWSWDDELVGATNQLLSRRWFHRLWVRQEVTLAGSRAALSCGSGSVSWPDFRKGLYGLFSKPVLLPRFRRPLQVHQLMETLKLLYGLMVQPESTSLVQLRYTFCPAECSDPRDRIYGLLSLLDDKSRMICSPPDYSQQAPALYQDITERYMRSCGLDILTECQHGLQSFAPSWVPPWSSNISIKPLPVGVSASSRFAAVFDFEPPGVLRALGVTTMVVSAVSHFPVLEKLGTHERIDIFHAVMASVKTAGGLAPDHYSAGGSFAEAYVRTIIGNDVAEVVIPPNDRRPKVSEIEAFAARGFNEIHASRRGPSGEELRIISDASYFSSQKSLFRNEAGYIGICGAPVQVGDKVVTILGCKSPLVLRSAGRGQYSIVGNCYAHGFSYGEAVLGPLPAGVRPAYRLVDDRTGYSEIYSTASGGVLPMDPRLDRMIGDRHDIRDIFEKHPGSQFKMDPDILKEAGLAVEWFNIV